MCADEGLRDQASVVHSSSPMFSYSSLLSLSTQSGVAKASPYNPPLSIYKSRSLNFRHPINYYFFLLCFPWLEIYISSMAMRIILPLARRLEFTALNPVKQVLILIKKIHPKGTL